MKKENLFLTNTKKCDLYLLMLYKLNSGLIRNFFNQEIVQSFTNCWFFNKYPKKQSDANKFIFELFLFEFQIKIFIYTFPLIEIKSYQQNIFLFEYFVSTVNQAKNQETMEYLYKKLIFEIIESRKIIISSDYIIKTNGYTRDWLKNYQKNNRCFLFRSSLFTTLKKKKNRFVVIRFNFFFKIKKIWKKKQKHGQKNFIDIFRNNI
ncbi:hypothetical protein T484DRAFT_1989418 [Baffinella frigidus]|nr:hypothetical protein T484DRAFT_1989418 [Cryptophyta sp. CCMP2293]